MHGIHAANARVENLAQVLSRQLKFFHDSGVTLNDRGYAYLLIKHLLLSDFQSNLVFISILSFCNCF
jgi:hypothetical protein